MAKNSFFRNTTMIQNAKQIYNFESIDTFDADDEVMTKGDITINLNDDQDDSGISINGLPLSKFVEQQTDKAKKRGEKGKKEAMRILERAMKQLTEEDE